MTKKSRILGSGLSPGVIAEGSQSADDAKTIVVEQGKPEFTITLKSNPICRQLVEVFPDGIRKIIKQLAQP